MSSNKSLFFFVLCFALIFTAGSAYAAVEQLTSKWVSNVDDRVKALGVGDVTGDNVSEVVAADSRKVYVFSAAGKLLKTYPVNYSVSVIYVSDIDGDGAGEILLGTGYMETQNLSVERFDFTDKDNIHEKPEILYKVTRNLGDVYMIKYGAKEPVKWLSVGEWVRDIKADDMNGDGSTELLIASGGTNTDYIELVSTGVNPDTKNATYIYNYTENHYENGSILVFLANRSLAVSYRTNNILWYVYPMFLQKAGKKVLVSGSTDISLQALDGTIVSSFKSLDSNYTLQDVFSDKISQSKASELIVWFSSPAVDGAYLLDLDGIMLWQYRSPSKNLRGVYSVNLDIDAGKEVVLAAPQSIYVLDGAGKLKWSYVVPVAIDRIVITDLGDNAYADFVLSSGNKVLIYETNEKFLNAQLAATYYQQARDNYESRKYAEALANLTNAKDLYSQLSDNEGLAAADSLLLKVNLGIKDMRKDTALSLYNKARSEYYLGNHSNAKEYLLKAKEIYAETGDSDGVSKCDALLNEMNKGEEQQTTTLPGSATLPGEENNTKQPATGTQQGISPFVSALAVIILVLLVIYSIKHVKDHPPKPGKSSREEEPEPDRSMDAISIAVSKSEDTPKPSAEYDEDPRQKTSSDTVTSDSENTQTTTTISDQVIEKIVPPQQSADENPASSAEDAKPAEGKAIPMGYIDDTKEEKKESKGKEKTPETGSDTVQ